MSGGRLVNECFSRTLPNGTGATAKVAICSCMGFAGFIPQIDEEPCWEARCNVGTKTCLTRHVEGYFNLVSAGRGGRWCIVAENATLEWQEPACSSLKNRHLYASTHIREHFLLILSLSHTHTHILIPAFPPRFPLGPSLRTAVLHDASRSVFRPARCGHIVQKRRLQPVSNNNFMYHTVAMFGDHRERWVESVEDHRGRRPSPGHQGRHRGRILRTRLHDFVDSIGCEHASHVASGTF